MSSIGDLVVNLGANTRGFDRGIDRSQSKLRGFASGAGRMLKAGVVAGIGVATVATAGLVRQMGKLDEVAKLSQRSGLDPRFISAFGFAAEQSGSSVESANRAIDQFTRRMGDAKDGAGASATALKGLGLASDSTSFDAFLKQNPEKQFMRVAEAISQLPTAAERADAAYQLFGRSGQELVNVLATGEDGLRAFKDEAERLGLGFDASEIGKVEKANDAINRIQRSTGALFGQLAIEAAPAIEAVSEGFLDIVSSAKRVLPPIVDTVKSVFHDVEDVIGDATVVAQVAWDQYPQIVDGAVKDIPKIMGAVFDWVETNTVRMFDNLVKLAKDLPGVLKRASENLGEEVAFKLGLSDERRFQDVLGKNKLKGFTDFKMPELSKETTGVIKNLQESLEAAQHERDAGRQKGEAPAAIDRMFGEKDKQRESQGLSADGGTGSGFAQRDSVEAASIIAKAFNASRGKKEEVNLLQQAVNHLADIAAPNMDLGPEMRIQEA